MIKELIKKYAILVILALIISRLGKAIIITIWPDLLTVNLVDSVTVTYGDGYLEWSIEMLLNILFIALLSREMKKLNFQSITVLIMTFFSNMIGVLFFLIISASKILNSKKKLK